MHRTLEISEANATPYISKSSGISTKQKTGIYCIAQNFGGRKQLAKLYLANLSPASSFFRYYKQLVDKFLANLY